MNASLPPLLILGTGTFAVETAEVASEVPGVEVAGFVENMDRTRCLTPVDGKPVFWIDELGERIRTQSFVCGLGTTHRSRFTDAVERLGGRFVSLIHPSARVSASSELGRGCVLHPGVIVAGHSRLGDHVCVNRGATIGHHTQVDDLVTIGPGVNLAGNCRIGRATYVGIGATIIDHITVGPQAVVGAGAVVTEAVPERVLVVGVPARIVKRDIDGK
jgi:acetyltransferase EpsM